MAERTCTHYPTTKRFVTRYLGAAVNVAGVSNRRASSGGALSNIFTSLRATREMRGFLRKQFGRTQRNSSPAGSPRCWSGVFSRCE